MIEKNVAAIRAHLGGLTSKNFRHAVAVLPNIVASMEDDEDILYGFIGLNLQKNNGRESVTNNVSLLTNKRYYFAGNDGYSSAFFPQQKSGSVDLKDVHAVTMGTQTGWGPYVAFETKNDDYKLILGYGTDQAKAKACFDEVIKIAQKSTGANSTIQAALSPADELKKFKELLDMGVITQEEFDVKKKQLLGL